MCRFDHTCTVLTNMPSEHANIHTEHRTREMQLCRPVIVPILNVFAVQLAAWSICSRARLFCVRVNTRGRYNSHDQAFGHKCVRRGIPSCSRCTIVVLHRSARNEVRIKSAFYFWSMSTTDVWQTECVWMSGRICLGHGLVVWPRQVRCAFKNCSYGSMLSSIKYPMMINDD